MSLTASEMTPADIAAVTNNGMSSGWGDGNGAWWLIILFLFAIGGWGNNGFGGGAGNGGMFPYYYFANNTDSGVQRGFDTAAITGQLNGIQTSISNGFANAEVAECNRAMNSLQQNYANTQAIDSRLDTIAMNLQQCCCDNRAGIADLKYTIATENCADRYEAAQNTRDIIENANRNNQSILDKLCQLELDAKNDKIADLERQLTMANMQASQTAQNAFIQQGLTKEVDALYNRLSNCPVPAVPVYGRQPIFTCGQNTSCNCGAM